MFLKNLLNYFTPVKNKISFFKRGLLKEIKKIGKTQILVLGDSHASIFRNLALHMPNIFFEIVIVRGATISGLQNPNSTTQAKPIFEEAVRKFSKSKICIVLLGEVDAGFVIWYRAQKHKISVEQIFEQTLKNYSIFLDNIAEKFPIICISAPLPTILDDQEWGDVANKRREVKTSQMERTKLTMQLNSRMQEYCISQGYHYINLDLDSLGSDFIVKNQLRNKVATNHHYDKSAYLQILIPPLEQLIERITSS